MAIVHESIPTVQFDQALLQVVAKAKAAYPAERVRIERGLQIALADGVTLLADGTAVVASQSHPGEAYRVNGHCTCRDAATAPEGHCKHRWAKTLVKKARCLAQQLAAESPADTYYATYTAPSGTAYQGTAQWTTHGWLFVADCGYDPLYAAAQAIALGGNVTLACLQAEADGNLAAKVCGRPSKCSSCGMYGCPGSGHCYGI